MTRTTTTTPTQRNTPVHNTQVAPPPTPASAVTVPIVTNLSHFLYVGISPKPLRRPRDRRRGDLFDNLVHVLFAVGVTAVPLQDQRPRNLLLRGIVRKEAFDDAFAADSLR